MLTRRHIRVKVLQSLYAFYQSNEQDLDKQEKFLLHSIYKIQDLQALLLHLIISVRDHARVYLQKSQKKYLATDIERNPSRVFVDNNVIDLLSKNETLKQYLQDKKLDNWRHDDEYVQILFNELREKDWYLRYLENLESSFKDDQKFVIRLYREIIAPNEKLYDYLEDNQLTWVDDFPLVNTTIVKMLERLQLTKSGIVFNKTIFKNEEDKDYALQLLRKVILNNDSLTTQIDKKTPNWDKDRIAEIDFLLLKMGIAEFLYFPSIPIKVTINEYLEISKEYSTSKSSIFINGILDKLVKEFTQQNKLNKIGRGLR